MSEGIAYLLWMKISSVVEQVGLNVEVCGREQAWNQIAAVLFIFQNHSWSFVK